MDPNRAAEYYDDVKAKGAAAAQFKRGLGFKPQPQESPPSRPAASGPPIYQPRPVMPYPIYYPQPSPFPAMYGTPQAPQRPNASPWTAHRSGDLVYYYSSVTGVSQWQRPPELMSGAGIPTETPKPIASERIPNTTWTEVKCEDGRVYYYNMVTKATVWHVPPEVVRSRQPSTVIPLPTPTPVLPTVAAPEGVAVEFKRGRKASSAEIQAFKDLLRDSGVTAFARYEKEAAELNAHPSWQGVTLEKERRALFDAFIRERAQQERQNKAPTEADARRAFEALLMEAREAEMKQYPDAPFTSTLFGESISLDGLQHIYQTDHRWQSCSAEMREASFQAFCKRYPFEPPLHLEGTPLAPNRPESPAQSAKRARSKSLSPPREAPPPSEGKVDPREGSSVEKQKRARVEQEVRESQRRLRRASHAAAVSDYKTLLSELVKQPHVQWEAISDRIATDIQGRGRSRCMDDRERERLFYDHVEGLHDAAVRDYERLLGEKLGTQPPQPTDQTETAAPRQAAWESFEAAEKLLNLDFHALQPSSDAKRKLWRRHVGKTAGDGTSKSPKELPTAQRGTSRNRQR